MTIPMIIGRRLDSCGSVVGFSPDSIRPSMAGLYRLRSQVSGRRSQKNRIVGCEANIFLARSGDRRGCFRFPGLPRIQDVVVAVFNRQRGAPAETNIADGLVATRKPEAFHLHVLVMDLAFLRPE